MKKKITAIIALVSMLVSAFAPVGSVYAAEQERTADILVDESFDKLTTGAMPSDSFIVQRAGGADMAVVNKPDAKNKSLYMTGSLGGTVALEKAVANPDNTSLTLSFKMNLLNSSSFTLLGIANLKAEKPTSIFEVVDSKLMDGDTAVAELETNKWHYVEIIFDTEKGTYGVSIDNQKVLRQMPVNDSEIGVLRITLSDTTQKLYLDEVFLRRADLGLDGQEYYEGSELFASPAQVSAAEDVTLDSFLLYQNSPRAMKDGEKLLTATPPFEEKKVMYLPLRFTAETLGAEVVWNAEEAVTFLVAGDNTYKVKTGESAVCHNGSPLELSGPVLTKNGAMYMVATDLAELLDQTILIDEGLIMLGGVQSLYTEARDRVKMEVRSTLKYERPTGEEMYNALLEKYPSSNVHPRIAGSAEDFERVKYLINTDATAQGMFNYLKKMADSYIEKGIQDYPSTGSLGYVKTTIRNNINTCAFVYAITGEEKYAEFAWKQVNTALDFTTWHNIDYSSMDTLSQFEVGYGIACAYDWMYDWINANVSSTDISKLKSVMKERIFDAVLKQYHYEINPTNTGGFASLDTIDYSWIYDAFNFNPHNNRSVLAACVAFAEDFPEEAKACMGYAMRSLEFHFDEWMPDGAWSEGPDYGYTTTNIAAYVTKLLNVAFGNDYGTSVAPGLPQAAIYNKYVLGPRGFFNYSDANKQTNPMNTYSFIFAETLNDKSIGYDRVQGLKKGGYVTEPEELLAYKPELVGDSSNAESKDGYFRTAETALLRSDWSQDAIFTGLHAHDNAAPHGQRDAGTFVLDAFNTEWFTELAYDPLSYTGGWTGAVGAYRARAEGHNTLVIDELPYNDFEKDEDGWVVYKNYNMEDIAIGDIPTEFVVRARGDADVGVIKDPNNSDNKCLEMRVNSTGSSNAADYYHSFPSPYIRHGIRYSLKIMFKDTDWIRAYEEQKIDASRMFEINSKNGNYYRPLTIASKDLNVGTESGAGWYSFGFTGGPVPGIWYDLVVETHPAENTYNISMDGGAKGGKYSVENLPISKEFDFLTTIRFQVNNAKTSVYIDDIEIKVSPEDSEFAYMGARELDQLYYEAFTIDEFESESQGSYAVTDLTRAYGNKAESVVRGLMLTDQRRAVVVRDEIKLNKKSDVYWFAHTRSEGNIDIAEDGKSAIIRKDGQRLWVGLYTDNPDAKLEEWTTAKLPGSPVLAGEADNSGWKKLTIKHEGVTEVNSTVILIPLLAGQTEPSSIPEVGAIADWSLPKEVLPTVDSITVDGTLIADFDPSKNMYDMLLPEGAAVPQVAATAAGANVTVKQAESLPGNAVITVEKDGLTAEYAVSLRLPEVIVGTIQGYTVTNKQVTTNAVYSAGRTGPTVLDNNFYTAWFGSEKGAWLQVDFEQQATLSKLSVAWWLYGNSRKYWFEVQMSDDAQTWTTIYDGETSGTTQDLEEYDFGGSYTGRYMRIVVKGHKDGNQVNISEIR